jgi:hypothetical protein
MRLQISTPSARISSPLRLVVAVVTLGLTAASISACSADPSTAPSIARRGGARFDMVCHNSAEGAAATDTVSVGPNGSCPHGFDMIPWY